MVWDVLLGLFALLIGAVLLFSGYRLALILLPIWGFFAGFWAGAGAITALFGDGFLSTVLSWVVGFVIALLFAVLSYLYWYVAVVLLGASVGASLGSGLMALFGVDPGFLMGLVALLVAVVFAIGTMLLRVPKYLLEERRASRWPKAGAGNGKPEPLAAVRGRHIQPDIQGCRHTKYRTGRMSITANRSHSSRAVSGSV